MILSFYVILFLLSYLRAYNYKQSILTAIFLHIDKLFVKYIHRKKYLYNFAFVILLNQHDILI